MASITVIPHAFPGFRSPETRDMSRDTASKTCEGLRTSLDSAIIKDAYSLAEITKLALQGLASLLIIIIIISVPGSGAAKVFGEQ